MIHSLFSHTRHRHGLFFFVRCCVRRAVSWRGVEIEGRTAFDSVICVAIEGPQDQGHVSVHAIFLFCVIVFIFASGRSPLFCDRQIEFQGQDVYLEHASSLLLDGHHHSHTVDFTVHFLLLTWYCSLLSVKLLRPRRGRVHSGMVSGCAVGHEVCVAVTTNCCIKAITNRDAMLRSGAHRSSRSSSSSPVNLQASENEKVVLVERQRENTACLSCCCVRS